MEQRLKDTQTELPQVDPDLEATIKRSQSYLLRIQYPEGFWWGELESNVTITSQYLLLTHFLGVSNKDVWDRIVNYLKRQQRPDGTWSLWYGGPGDLNCAIEAYFAMKLAGVSPEDPLMQKAREFILARGGVPKARVFTKIWLALFGQYNWKGIPVLPPELILAPTWFPFSIYQFGSWARATVVGMLILLTKKPTRPVPSWAAIDELYPGGREQEKFELSKPPSPFSWKRFFYYVDKLLRLHEGWRWKPLRGLALKKAEQWVVSHQEADGSWGGIQPPWVYALMALNSLGYAPDHPIMAKGLKGWESFTIQDDRIFYTQPCLSPVWDAAFAAIALVDSGVPPDHPALVQAGRWLLSQQILTGGDWQVKNKKGEPGGWAFEFENDLYPDTDDTAEVLIALHKLRLPEEAEKQQAMARGLQWLLSMQSKNGGWGSFDLDNTNTIVTRIPFCDFGEIIDPPTEDVSGHIVEYLGLLGYNESNPAVKRALSYLKRTQQKDGSWWGRWGVNYIYGTGAVVPALQALGQDMSQPYIRKAVYWLKTHQNPDDGWGEDINSYIYPPLGGQGSSTASQTAWALLAMLAAGEGEGEAVRRGISYLMRTQLQDGSWEEPYFTATGFPGDFMIKYHLYRNYFPLMALGRYRKFLQERDN